MNIYSFTNQRFVEKMNIFFYINETIFIEK